MKGRKFFARFVLCTGVSDQVTVHNSEEKTQKGHRYIRTCHFPFKWIMSMCFSC